MSENDIENPATGADEERPDVVEDEAQGPGEEPASLPFDVPEADAAEQRREVRLDEDDYR